MKNNEFFREYVEEAVAVAATLGLDLTTDYLEIDFVYPDMPHIQVTFTVGGMFARANLEEEEELH